MNFVTTISHILYRYMKNRHFKTAIVWLLPMFVVSLSSCDPFGIVTINGEEETPIPEPVRPEKIEGYAPIYGKIEDAAKIKSAGPAAIINEGKIYVKDNLLYQVETGKGIHVIDIKIPSSPQKIHFIEVAGAQEMAIKNNKMYTNNLNDLVVLDITNLNDVKLLERVTGVFHIFDAQSPPTSGWYECVDASKGDVIGWELKTLNYPNCSK